MKYKIFIDKDYDEEVLIKARERTPLIDAIEQLLLGAAKEITGYKDREAYLLDIGDIYCFTVEGNKLFAITENDRYTLKQRLYQVEEILPQSFIKINQSTIASIPHIKKFEVSFSGALMVVFKNGHTDYVSRRNVKVIKERFGL